MRPKIPRKYESLIMNMRHKCILKLLSCFFDDKALWESHYILNNHIMRVSHVNKISTFICSAVTYIEGRKSLTINSTWHQSCKHVIHSCILSSYGSEVQNLPRLITIFLWCWMGVFWPHYRLVTNTWHGLYRFPAVLVQFQRLTKIRTWINNHIYNSVWCYYSYTHLLQRRFI